MYDPDNYHESEEDYYERRAEAAMCDTPEWFDESLMYVYATAEDAEEWTRLAELAEVGG